MSSIDKKMQDLQDIKEIQKIFANGGDLDKSQRFLNEKYGSLKDSKMTQILEANFFKNKRKVGNNE